MKGDTCEQNIGARGYTWLCAICMYPWREVWLCAPVQARMRVIHKRRDYVDLYGSADTVVERERETATNRVGNK